MRALLVLNDVRVSQGYEGKAQASFTPGKNNADYGTLRFKTSAVRRVNEDGEWKNTYDNYTVDIRSIKADSKLTDILNQPNVRVSIHGELSQEEFNGNKFCRVSCRGPESMEITKFGDEGAAKQAEPAVAVNNDGF